MRAWSKKWGLLRKDPLLSQIYFPIMENFPPLSCTQNHVLSVCRTLDDWGENLRAPENKINGEREERAKERRERERACERERKKRERESVRERKKEERERERAREKQRGGGGSFCPSVWLRTPLTRERKKNSSEPTEKLWTPKIDGQRKECFLCLFLALLLSRTATTEAMQREGVKVRLTLTQNLLCTTNWEATPGRNTGVGEGSGLGSCSVTHVLDVWDADLSDEEKVGTKLERWENEALPEQRVRC